MTSLEQILISIVWIGYGLFAAYQSEGAVFKDDWQWFVYPVFAPLIFVLKALYGALKRYE